MKPLFLFSKFKYDAILFYFVAIDRPRSIEQLKDVIRQEIAAIPNEMIC